MIRRQHVVGEFFDEAEALRATLDARFKDAYVNSVNWNYFYVPGLYTYLRTTPRGLIPDALFDLFMHALRQWSMETLGLVPMGIPLVHLMVDGCRLELHSDFHNGVWGYVYSLTRWDKRRFSGGETLLMRDGVPSYKKHHVQGENLYDLIPARFNQLLVFDDRIVHGTPVIEGSMDPLEARLALVGHLRATSPRVSGELAVAAARRVILETMPHLAERIRPHREVQGMITFRIAVNAAGGVESVVILTDNLITASSGYEASDSVGAVRSAIQQNLMGLRFPACGSQSSLIIPVLVPIPDLRPMLIQIPRKSSRASLQEWALAHLADGEALGLSGIWEKENFLVQEPVAGSLRIDSDQIIAEFDPPMWVPSQRARFQAMVTEWLTSALSGARVAGR